MLTGKRVLLRPTRHENIASQHTLQGITADSASCRARSELFWGSESAQLLSRIYQCAAHAQAVSRQPPTSATRSARSCHSTRLFLPAMLRMFSTHPPPPSDRWTRPYYCCIF